MQKSLLARLEALEAVRPQYSIVCTRGGTEYTTTLFEAMQAGARFVRTVDGNTAFDELYKAILNTDPADLEQIAEHTTVEDI